MRFIRSVRAWSSAPSVRWGVGSAAAAVLGAAALAATLLTGGQPRALTLNATLTGNVTTVPLALGGTSGAGASAVTADLAKPLDAGPPATGTGTPPPTSLPPATEPPATEPPSTVPPSATPPATVPPTTPPPASPPPAQSRSAITLTAPKSSPVRKAIKLSGALSWASGTVPAGTTIALARSGPAGTKPPPASIVTGTGGSFSFGDTPQAYGTYTYTASYAGDAAHSAATARFAVTVTRLTPVLHLAPVPGISAYHARITLTATLTGGGSGRRVEFYVQQRGSTAWRLVGIVAPTSAGVARIAYTTGATSTYVARFPGDAQYAPLNTPGSVNQVRVAISQALAGYFASEAYQGATYRVYHHTATLKDTVTVAPPKPGQCVSIQIQVLYQGAWSWDLISGCGSLTSASQVFGSFSLARASGARYRIRAIFTPAKSDLINLANETGWLYFRVTA
ncbi:MAG TPA: hypothetical protein VH478_05890 [Trebonia sp.]|jgi:hypothetical protein|nr:hypothetical protein [Trebonia sp.]